MSTRTEKLEWLKAKGYRSEDLNLMVEDQKCQAANRINNDGFEAQLDYLLKMLTWEEIRAALWRERQFLQNRGMKSQSKVHPERNIKEKR
jgi:hypothetical protein